MVKKHLFFSSGAQQDVIDRFICPLLSDGNQYIPSANELKL